VRPPFLFVRRLLNGFIASLFLSLPVALHLREGNCVGAFAVPLGLG